MTTPRLLFDNDENVVDSTVLTGGVDLPELVFTNVTPGTTEATASGTATANCGTIYDAVAVPFEVRAKVITELAAWCTSP